MSEYFLLELFSVGVEGHMDTVPKLIILTQTSSALNIISITISMARITEWLFGKEE